MARMDEGRGVHKVLVGKRDGKSPLGDQDVDGRIILRWILRKWEGVIFWTANTGDDKKE